MFLSTMEVEFLIQFDMLDLEVLIERSFRSIRPLASLNWTSIVSLDLVGGSPEPLFAVLFVSLAELNLLAFFLQFGKSAGQLVSLIGELAHLTEKDHVGQVETAVLVVVREIGLGISAVHAIVTVKLTGF